MANSQVQLRKPTLDKDLEKLTFTEQATHFVLRTYKKDGVLYGLEPTDERELL